MWMLPSLVRLRVEVVPSQGVWLPSRGGAVTKGREMIHLRLRLLGRREIVLTCHFGGKLVVKLVVELVWDYVVGLVVRVVCTEVAGGGAEEGRSGAPACCVGVELAWCVIVQLVARW